MANASGNHSGEVNFCQSNPAFWQGLACLFLPHPKSQKTISIYQ
jgi:hypothetical protein